MQSIEAGDKETGDGHLQIPGLLLQTLQIRMSQIMIILNWTQTLDQPWVVCQPLASHLS